MSSTKTMNVDYVEYVVCACPIMGPIIIRHYLANENFS